MSATDGDRGSFGAVSYALASSSGGGGAASAHFAVNKESGQLCTVAAVDRDEGPGAFELTVTATDGVRANIFDR